MQPGGLLAAGRGGPATVRRGRHPDLLWSLTLSLLLIAGWQAASSEDGARPEPDVILLAEGISTRLQQAAALLEEISKRDEVRQVFMEGDAKALAAEAEALGGEFDSPLKLRLLLPGKFEVDRESKPPLGYASVELLRKAEQSPEALPAELHNSGGEDAHIVLIRRVTNADQKLIGMLHLSLAPGTYLHLDLEDSFTGYAELVQDIAHKATTVYSAGNQDARMGDPRSADIAGSYWRLDYWPPPPPVSRELEEAMENSMASVTARPMIMMVAVVVLLGLAGGAYWYLRRQRMAGGGEPVATGEGLPEIVYGGALQAIMEGKHPSLEKLIPDMPSLGITGPLQPLAQGLAGEDITLAHRPAATTAGHARAEAPSPAATPMTGETAPANDAPQPQSLPTSPPGGAPGAASAVQPETLSPIIFRAYDIRGIVGKTLTPGIVHDLGRAIGSEAEARGVTEIAVGRDGRSSSPELSEALIKGLQTTGRNVIDIGMVPTPLLYFATHHLNTGSGVMITGSHNGPAYNGLKIVLGGETLSGDAIQGLRKRVAAGAYSSGQGTVQTQDITADYLRRATEDTPVALGNAFKLVVDCGNGVAGVIAPSLYRALGHVVVELYCDVDGSFPNHHPDPSQPENLEDLIVSMKQLGADLGLAFDGDGDRLGVVDNQGNIIWPDRQMMLFARDVLSRNAGASIIYDVKCSRHLKSVIEENGGKAVMWKTGHSLIKSRMKELNAPLAGEMSGHIFFKERWFGFDDGLYAGVRLLEILAAHKATAAEVFAALPDAVATPELRIMLPEQEHAAFMHKLQAQAQFPDAVLTDIDGVRVDFQDGFGLIRPSNTTPCLIARFEAADDQGLARIQALFRELLSKVGPDLKLPF